MGSKESFRDHCKRNPEWGGRDNEEIMFRAGYLAALRECEQLAQRMGDESDYAVGMTHAYEIARQIREWIAAEERKEEHG